LRTILRTLLCVGAVAGGVAGAAADDRYRIGTATPITDAPGTPPRTNPFIPPYSAVVNTSGLVTGQLQGWEGGISTGVWSSGGVTMLPTPPGFFNGVGNAINSQGWVVGTSYTDFGKGTPTVWMDGVATTFTIPGQIDTEAFGINDRGAVVGVTGVDKGPPLGFVWKDGQVIMLPSLAPSASPYSVPTTLSNSGVVIGYSQAANGHTRAVMWADGSVTDLGVAGEFSRANDVSESGYIVGQRSNGAFVYKDGEVEYVSRAGYSGASLRSVNESGVAVGTLFRDGQREGFLYKDGQVQTLDELLGETPWQSGDALGVTDDGRLYVLGYDAEWRQTVYELVPDGTWPEEPPPGGDPGGGGSGPPGVPEPTTALLLGLAGLGAAGWRRLRK
jgi:probable HAF family extracellular repeat protein